jgi:hypothetical protein
MWGVSEDVSSPGVLGSSTCRCGKSEALGVEGFGFDRDEDEAAGEADVSENSGSSAPSLLKVLPLLFSEMVLHRPMPEGRLGEPVEEGDNPEP